MGLMSPEVLEHYADVHQQTLSRIQIAAETAAENAWMANGNDDMSATEMAAWAAILWLIAKPAVDAANSATYQYMTAMNAYLGISALLPEPDTDWFRDDFEGWALSPVSSIAGNDGDMIGTAAHVSKLVNAATRTAELNAFDQIIDTEEWSRTKLFTDERPDDILIADTIEAAEQITLQAAQDGYPTTERTKQAKRWKRVPQAGACGWCLVLSDKTLSDEGVKAGRLKGKSGTGGKWHDYCRCTKRQLTPQEARDFKPKWGAMGWEDIIDDRFDADDKQGDEST